MRAGVTRYISCAISADLRGEPPGQTAHLALAATSNASANRQRPWSARDSSRRSARRVRPPTNHPDRCGFARVGPPPEGRTRDDRQEPHPHLRPPGPIRVDGVHQDRHRGRLRRLRRRAALRCRRVLRHAGPVRHRVRGRLRRPAGGRYRAARAPTARKHRPARLDGAAHRGQRPSPGRAARGAAARDGDRGDHDRWPRELQPRVDARGGQGAGRAPDHRLRMAVPLHGRRPGRHRGR